MAGLYKIYPTVHWLFAVQAFALTLAIVPLWYLALEANLDRQQAKTVILAYLLYPLIFNVNLADFHPEVMAVPAIFGAVLATKKKKLWWFSLAIAFILSCKAVLALTVIAMGIWLIGWSKQYTYGATAIIIGLIWFIVSTQLIIPHFSGSEAAAVDRYSYLGDSVIEIIQNLFGQPWLIGSKVFSLSTLEYLFLLVLPILWAISPRSHFAPLIGAVPILLVNILSESASQRNLVHHYSLPIVPWLFLVAIATIANHKTWLKKPKRILIWSVCAFLALGKFGYFGSLYLESIDTWQATREAITQINSKGGVLTTTDIAPHLTHRSLVQLATIGSESNDFSKIEYVLLNSRHPGWASSEETINNLIEKFQQMPAYKLQYQKDGIVLFKLD